MNDLHHLLQEIHQKPGLYIGRPSINDLYMFLTGYNFALRQLNQTYSEQESHFREFQPWLQKRLNIKTSQSWSRLILFHCMDEREAFFEFFKLFSEFLGSRNANGHKQVLETEEQNVLGHDHHFRSNSGMAVHKNIIQPTALRAEVAQSVPG
ncbi:MAG: hypothetical protein ACPGWR_08275 [Ardenticatenaceae bacterium]